PAVTATTASTQNTIPTSTAQPFQTTTRDTSRSWATTAGSKTVQPISMNRSGRSSGSLRRAHTRTVSTSAVLTSTHAQSGRTGPAPPPRKSGTENAAPAVRNRYRPACRTSRSTPESSAVTPPTMSADRAGANGPHTEKPVTPIRKTRNATGIHTTNHTPSCAAATSPTARLPAAIAGATNANISGSS